MQIKLPLECYVPVLLHWCLSRTLINYEGEAGGMPVMGNRTDPTVPSLLDILDEKWPRPEPDFDSRDESRTVETVPRSPETPGSETVGNISTFSSDLTTRDLSDLDTLVDVGTSDWETSTSPMTTISLDSENILSLYYGFIIAILVLAIVVMLIVIFLCCEWLNKSRGRVIFAGPGEAAPNAVCSGATARREVFQSLAERELSEEIPTLCRISPKVVEEIPMHEIASSSADTRTRKAEISQTESRGFPEPPPLARVYAATARRWTPDYNANVIPAAVANGSSASTGRNRVNLPRGRGSGSSRGYSRRSYTVPVPVQPTRRGRLPRYNLAGESILTPSEPSFVRELQRRSSETDVINHRRGHEFSLIVPTNSPNCSSDNSDNSGSVFLPGDGRELPLDLEPDSDFGASAGVNQCNVSSNTSMRGVGESLATASYTWDGYDPSFRRRPLSYVDGAYYPVLGERQYWV